MHIALFGGSFDPPHIGHKQVATALIEQNLVDQVWYVPVFTHPWAGSMGKDTLAPYADRVSMLNTMLGERQRVAEYKKVSYTYDTIQYFQQLHPDWMFTWVMGSEYIPKFKDFLVGHPALITLPFYIYPREGHSFDGIYSNMTPLPSLPTVKASSTEVRERIATGKSVTNLLVPAVAEILRKRKLYQTHQGKRTTKHAK